MSLLCFLCDVMYSQIKTTYGDPNWIFKLCMIFQELFYQCHPNVLWLNRDMDPCFPSPSVTFCPLTYTPPHCIFLTYAYFSLLPLKTSLFITILFILQGDQGLWGSVGAKVIKHTTFKILLIKKMKS